MKQEFSHDFSEVFHRFFTGWEKFRTCEQGTFHRVWTCEKTCEEACEFQPVKKPVKCGLIVRLFHSFFHRVGNLKTCEQGIFHRVSTCEKPCEMGVCLAAVYRFKTMEKACEISKLFHRVNVTDWLHCRLHGYFPVHACMQYSIWERYILLNTCIH